MSEAPVRVAHVIGKLNAAGVEAVINNYYRYIDHSRYQFDFFIDADSNCEPPQELIDMGARYFVIPPYQKLPKYLKTLTGYFSGNKYRIVHSGMNTLSVFPLYAAKKAGVPVRINHNHSTASKGETKKNVLKYALRPFAGRYATDRCACSEYAGRWLFGDRAMENGEIRIFNNAIDLEQFRFDPEVRAQVRKELGIENKTVIGHVGRFCFQKNHEFLIDIFSEIRRRTPDAVLMLVGIGELTDAIKEKVHVMGLDDSVLFLGRRTDCARLYQAMDVFVLPSRYEGLPVVGIEAQAAGLPCVFSTEITKETLITSNAVMMELSEPAESWAQTALSAARQPRTDSTEEMTAAGFDIRTQAKRLETFYDECLRRG